MSEFHVLWTIAPARAPQPKLFCSRCDAIRSFESSGRFRLNANGKRLDAWLIYKCDACDDTWNRPLLDRAPVGGLSGDLLQSLQSNDQRLARKIAFDVADLARKRIPIEASGAYGIRKEWLAGDIDAALLRIAITGGAPIRFDRLLAGELGLARARVARLDLLDAITGGRPPLNRPARDGAMITIDLSQAPDRPAILEAAASAP